MFACISAGRGQQFITRHAFNQNLGRFAVVIKPASLQPYFQCYTSSVSDNVYGKAEIIDKYVMFDAFAGRTMDTAYSFLHRHSAFRKF